MVKHENKECRNPQCDYPTCRNIRMLERGIPFDNFRVTGNGALSYFTVNVKPRTADASRHMEQLQFIKDAIREKLGREPGKGGGEG